MISRPGYPTDPLCGLRPGPSSIWASISPLSQRIQPTLTFQNPATLLTPLWTHPLSCFPSLAPREHGPVTAYPLRNAV